MGISLRWVFGGLIVFMGLLALYLASNAHDDMMYLFGIMIFIFAVFYIFGLIGKYVGRPTHDAADTDSPAS